MSNLFILDISRNLIINWLRTWWAFTDRMVYSAIRILFSTIFSLSNFELTSFYADFQERVYVIIGIFMLFKVTISLITYLVNPDKISDKEQGASKLIVRILIVLVMLVSLPTFFSLLTEVQSRLMPVIPRIVIGQTDELSNTSVTTVANNMSFSMLKGFIHVKDNCGDDEIATFDDLSEHVNDSCFSGGKFIYKYDYLPIISTIVGILACFILFTLAISVAIRSFKMLILKMIAPAPIISYIDPKSSKDGAFASWSKMLLTTWLELFILLAVIYFIVYMVDKVISVEFIREFANGVEFKNFGGSLILPFIVLGLLFFAKQAPQFIFDALGIKTKGNFTRMLGFGLSTAAISGTVASTISNMNKTDRDAGKNPNYVKNVGAGLFSGLVSGFKAGDAILGTDKPKITSGFDVQQQYNANNIDRITGNSTLLGRAGTFGSMVFMGQTSADVLERNIKSMDDYNKALDTAYDRAESETKKSTKTIGSIAKGSSYFANYKSIADSISTADSLGLSEIEYVQYDANGNVIDRNAKMSLLDAKANINWLLRENTDNFMVRTSAGNDNDFQDIIYKTNIQAANDIAVNLERSGDIDLDARVFGGTDRNGTTYSGYLGSDGKLKTVCRQSLKDIQDLITINKSRNSRKLSQAKANESKTKKGGN